MREVHERIRSTRSISVSVRASETASDSTRFRCAQPLAVDGRFGLDGSHVDGTRTGCERRQNAYFADRGLFNLVQARAEASQSFLREDHQPESRVREIRMHGSEGRETGDLTGLPYPYQSS